MRVLMTADTVGGVWTYALELARALRALGVGVQLATMGRPISPRQRSELDAAGIIAHESRFKLEWMPDPWQDVDAAGDWLLELERELEPDVIHLNGYCHAATPFSAPCLVAAHSCVCSWWKAVKQRDAPESCDAYRQRVTAGLTAAASVVAVTHAMGSALQQCYGPLPRVQVIYNGRDAARFTPADKRSYILAAGRLWDPAKNLAVLERVASRITWPIYVAGETDPGDNALGASAGRLGVLSEAELARWLGGAAIYAHPARYEPFGLAVLEAALARCALVLGDIPSLRELWDGAALFVNPDDPRALARSIQWLANHPRARDRFAHRAHRRAAELNPQRMAHAYLSAYRQLIAARPAAKPRGRRYRTATNQPATE